MFKKNAHLTDKQLIRFIDGEMPNTASDRIRRHLSTCTPCSSRRENLERATSAFTEIHSAIGVSQLQSSAKSRAMLETRLLEARSAPRSLLERFSLAASAHPWACLYATIAIVVLSITMLDLQGRFFKTPSMPLQLEARLLPDSGLTPGVTRPVGLDDICSQNDNDLDPAVSPSLKKAIFQEYGMSDRSAGDYQVDYLINPQLGGTDDVHNLWPEPYRSRVWNARAKDALEDRLHQMVCNNQIDLASAQHDLATDWIAAYKKYFHAANPS